MPHFVYMLRCAGNRIYTGYAVDVDARFEQHVSGKGAKFTKAFPPQCILRKFELPSHEQALRLEARIKMLPRERKELLAAGDESIEAELLAGLGETLGEKSARERKEKREAKKRAQSKPATKSGKRSKPAQEKLAVKNRARKQSGQ